ncbi:S41 family peptidase [Aliikangiella coralliicola]|uniref:Tricorn protease homolog n=1 Tax=Aliikangiella coralliicola TaxID=2592383 RepID=A0A545UJL9_9GAMM|nr:S41 family peptidase [Aliikangiella coralliicola]TQV89659.1 peptidase S41 [Aliikangiella coralliicola]
MKLRLTLALIFAFSSSASASVGYYRSPTLHQNTLVFTAEGDLWVTRVDQPEAKRLTTHPAEEKQAKLSPDGTQIAYAANYEGATEVYVIPVKGGVSKRVSFENSSVRVQGWTPDGNILYSTNNRIGPTGNWTLRKVNPKTLVVESIPLADAVEGAIDQQGKNIYFTQFGLQISTDNARNYRGGAKGELWQFKLGSKSEAKKLTGNHIGSSRQPMVHQNKLYFISDASGSDNIWSMNLEGGNFQQVTQYQDWPIRSAQINGDKIVYQHGADIKLLDLSSSKSQKLNLELTSDFPNLRERWINKPLKYMTSSRLAGKQKKIVITARGRVAIAGIDKSRLVEIATPLQSRTRNALLSHDGKWVYAINDASGENEIWRFAADGSKNSKQLTDDGSIFRWSLSLSPNGKWIAHDDRSGNLWLLNTDNARNKKILSGSDGLSPYADVNWSADSRLLAITQSHQDDERSRIVLYSLDDKKQQVLTSDKYNAYSPAFSPDGEWLYFLSDRHFKATPGAPWGDRVMGTVFDRRTQIFAYGLTQSAVFPFQSPNELMPKNSTTKDKAESKKSAKKKTKKTVEWKGLTKRLWQVPIDSGNYSNLTVNDKFLFVQDRINEPKSKPTIKSIKIKPSPELVTFTDKVAGYALSNDGKKIFVLKEGNDNANMFIVDSGDKFPKDTKGTKVVTKDWQLLLNPKQEWKQMFQDAWLMHRDFFYDKNMRGIDWNEAKKKYTPLLDRLTDRYELNEILKLMMGELNSLHSQVRGGDYPSDPSMAKTATLGAILSQTRKGVSIDHIYRYDPELPSQASPLLKPGVNAAEGDIISAVNGVKTNSVDAVNRQLRNQAGKQVLLELKRGKKQVKTVVVPASRGQDYQFRYNDWVNNNREKVSKSAPQIGYLHLHAMGSNDIANFAREFYANYRKHGLIIDVRRNRGGNIDSWIIEKLLRRAWAFWQPTTGDSFTNMQQTFRGHLVVLADQYTYSDGETFTAGVKALNLGPVIGKQTAGAGVWLRSQNRMVDNGIARAAEFAQYAIDGRWVLEGYGVKPDIEVDNLPYETFMGKDAQLEAAIAYLNKKLKEEPIPKLQAKPFSDVNTPAEDIQ